MRAPYHAHAEYSKSMPPTGTPTNDVVIVQDECSAQVDFDCISGCPE